MNVNEIIKQNFDPYFEAPLEAWKSFTDLGEVISTAKNQILKINNTTEKYLSFILKGSGGILIWKDTNFVCIDLCYEGDFFGDYMSFLIQQPSPLEVVTFESSEIFRISHSEFIKLSFNTEFGDKICRFAAEGLLIHKQDQQINLLIKSVAQRYEELLKKQPNISLRTPQKHIASYLGITPQSLSRIRSRNMKKH